MTDKAKELAREWLAEAGTKFDGHVTHGSLDEQMKILERYGHLCAAEALEQFRVAHDLGSDGYADIGSNWSERELDRRIAAERQAAEGGKA